MGIQLDLLGMGVKMLRRELARYQVTADSIGFQCSGKVRRMVELVGCLAMGGWVWTY